MMYPFFIKPENPELNDLIFSGNVLPRYVLKQIAKQIKTNKESKLKSADILLFIFIINLLIININGQY